MTYSKQADADIERIAADYTLWPAQTGAMASLVKYFAAKADAEHVRCEHIKRHPEEIMAEFFRYATPEDVVSLLVEIQDQLTSHRNYLGDAPLCNLSEAIGQAEDAIFDYAGSREREAEALAEAMEFRDECRRDEAMMK